MAPHQRATDGITVNKIMVSITALSISTTLAIGTYEYNKNLDHTDANIERIEIFQREVHEDINRISESLHELVVQQKVDYAMQANMGAKIGRNEEDIDRIKEEMQRLNIYIRRNHPHE